MDTEGRTVEQALAQIGGAAHGVVTNREARLAGVTRQEIKRRLRTGALIRQYRGVYRVGHRAPSIDADYLAAVRACGSEAVLSGRAAAYLLGLLKGPPPPPEVTARTNRRVPGVVTHRCRSLRPEDTMKWRSVPVTTVARTLIDLAATAGAPELALACHEAGIHHDTTPAQVERVLERRPNVPGAGRLRRVLRGDVHVTLSVLERRFLALLRKHGLPLPQTNHPANGRRVDCRWPDHALTVELDSYRYHRSRHAWEQDRLREREARGRGDEFRRYTYGDVFEDPTFLLGELNALIREPRA